MTLHDAQITAVVRCAPPEQTSARRARELCILSDEEYRSAFTVTGGGLPGKIAFDGYVAHLIRTGAITRRGDLHFAHAAEFAVPHGRFLLATYHPSLQNTNTGKLTAGMFLRIFQRARTFASKDT